MRVFRAELVSIASSVSLAIVLAVALGLAGQSAGAQDTPAQAYNSMNASLRDCEQLYEQALKEIAGINADPGNYTVAQLNAAESAKEEVQSCVKTLLKLISVLEKKFPEFAGGNLIAGRSDDLARQWAQAVVEANNLQAKVNNLKVPHRPK